MQHFDLSPLYRSTIGFDRVASLLDSFKNIDIESSGFPPYDIIRHDENRYQITIALAGFSKDDLDIEVKENVLTVRGEKVSDIKNQDREILHKGIAERNFVRRFQLADYVEVKSADLKNGLLHIELAREIPEAMKTRTIKIGSDDTLIESKAE